MDNNQKQYYRDLAERVESGEYFNEAREWFLKKYSYTFIERAYVMLLILGFAILGVFLISYYSAILPIKKSLPIQVNISSAADFSTRITYLGNKDKTFDINSVFIKYFSGRFVEAIESYDYKNDFKKLRVNKNIIEALASKDILAYYLDKISIRNDDSLILKYRKRVFRTINVDPAKIEIAPFNEKILSSFDENSDDQKNDIKKYEITVNFEAVETEKDGAITKSNWQSKIILSFQTITYNYTEKDFSPLNFKVLNYESKKID